MAIEIFRRQKNPKGALTHRYRDAVRQGFALDSKYKDKTAESKMAIYHLSMSTISRRSGQSVVAAAAYRSASRIVDERTGEIHDYTRKHGVESSFLILPKEAGTAWDREALWNAAESSEKRKDAKVGREVRLALPAELAPAQRLAVAEEMARHLTERYGVAVEVSIHEPNRRGDERNHHAHLLMSTRRLGPEGFGAKTRELDDLKAGPVEIEHIRAEWELIANRALARAGQEVRIDHRSLALQGVDRAPTVHLGPQATAMERRGELTRIGAHNRQVRALNLRAARLARVQNRLDAAMDRERRRQQERPRRLPVEGVRTPGQLDQAKRMAQEDEILRAAGCLGKSYDHASRMYNAESVQQRAFQAEEAVLSRDIMQFNRSIENASLLVKINPFAHAKINKQGTAFEARRTNLEERQAKGAERIKLLEQAKEILWKRETPEREAEARETAVRERELAADRARQAERREYDKKLYKIAETNPELGTMGRRIGRIKPYLDQIMRAAPAEREELLERATRELAQEAGLARAKGRGRGGLER